MNSSRLVYLVLFTVVGFFFLLLSLPPIGMIAAYVTGLFSPNSSDQAVFFLVGWVPLLFVAGPFIIILTLLGLVLIYLYKKLKKYSSKK